MTNQEILNSIATLTVTYNTLICSEKNDAYNAAINVLEKIVELTKKLE